MKWEELDEKLVKMVAETTLNDARERRKLREAFKDIQLSLDHCLFNEKHTGIKMTESYYVNSQGSEIFSKSWIPENVPIKALFCWCHGYGETCTFFFEGIARKFASRGYAVFALDYPGFGLSEGLHGYIPDFNKLVDAAIEHFSKVKENPEYENLPRFIVGQSMGGAIALKSHLKEPNAWDGAILCAPMCKIAEEVVPSWVVTQFLIGMAKFLPKGKLVPNRDLTEMACKDLKKRDLCKFNVISYKDNPRLRTALEMLKTTYDIESRLAEVSLPLLILHGDADIVTSPEVSKALYERASSSDKKLLLYPDGCHCLLEGDTDEMMHKVFGDMLSWLDERVEKKKKMKTFPTSNEVAEKGKEISSSPSNDTPAEKEKDKTSLDQKTKEISSL